MCSRVAVTSCQGAVLCLAMMPPEKLRGVFEALLANPASRTLMRGLLKGAGMPFNEEAFEEQVKVGAEGGRGQNPVSVAPLPPLWTLHPGLWPLCLVARESNRPSTGRNVTACIGFLLTAGSYRHCMCSCAHVLCCICRTRTTSAWRLRPSCAACPSRNCMCWPSCRCDRPRPGDWGCPACMPVWPPGYRHLTWAPTWSRGRALLALPFMQLPEAEVAPGCRRTQHPHTLLGGGFSSLLPHHSVTCYERIWRRHRLAPLSESNRPTNGGVPRGPMCLC